MSAKHGSMRLYRFRTRGSSILSCRNRKDSGSTMFLCASCAACFWFTMVHGYSVPTHGTTPFE